MHSACLLFQILLIFKNPCPACQSSLVKTRPLTKSLLRRRIPVMSFKSSQTKKSLKPGIRVIFSSIYGRVNMYAASQAPGEKRKKRDCEYYH